MDWWLDLHPVEVAAEHHVQQRLYFFSMRRTTVNAHRKWRASAGTEWGVRRRARFLFMVLSRASRSRDTPPSSVEEP